MLTKENIERFMSHVRISESCWEWIGCINHGYGTVGIGGKTLKAHRVAYEIAYGPIPEGMDICHHCDNPPCVRPDHLFAGTASDNLSDSSSKGRSKLQRHPEFTRGENHPMAKLKSEDVRQIRLLRRDGFSAPDIARTFGVSDSLVYAIESRKIWTNI